MDRPYYVPAIDGLRLFAFIFVFFAHFNNYIVSPFLHYIGWSGVEFFFLISGFLLTKLLVTEYKQSKNIHLYKYLMRRILRIWPLYFIYLLSTILISVLFINHSVSLNRVAGNIFFYDNILTAIKGFNYNFSSYHLWSISLEEQYYLLLPFLIPWLIKQNARFIKRFVAIIALLLILTRVLLSLLNSNYFVYYMSPVSGDSFLAGIILGLGIFDNWLQKTNSYVAFVTGCLFLLLLYNMPQRGGHGFQNVLLYTIPALSFVFFFIAAVYSDKKILTWLFCNKVVKYLGKISFGLYIFHIIAIFITRHLFTTQNLPMEGLGFIFSLLITILLAILSYEFVEKYFLKMKYRFTIIKNREA